MARDLTSAFIAQLTADEKRPIILFEGEFATGTVRFWSGHGDLSWNSQTWTGAGTLGRVATIDETTEMKATGLAVEMSGISSSITSLILAEVRRNMPGKIYLGFLDSAGAVVSDPVVAFSGLLDVALTDDSGSTVTVTVQYDSRIRDLERNFAFRYTAESQAALYDGDLGFDYVPGLQEYNGVWGRS